MPAFKLNRISCFIPLLLLLWNCSSEPKQDQEEVSGSKMFTLLSPQETNIDFQNLLTEGLNTNILVYEYFYNGGGVAAGDLNGDDLTDLYFTSNMADNKLYINQGEMKFKEAITATGRPGPWKTGVTMADVNGDGKLDIYLSYSGALPEDKRANQLYINTGNNPDNMPEFEEKAAEFGLASTGYSNQGYFFDYDHDGDLDMLLLNHNPKNLPILNEVSTQNMLKQDDPLQGVRLFKNNHLKFEDVTQESGLSSSPLTYGLGLGITDVNNDGWPDFYISNDYNVPDYLYVNNRNGTFTNKLPESIRHNSQFSMGNDIADVNNDALPDIVTLDMLPEDNYRQKLLLAPDNYNKFDLNVRSGFYYQYMRNMLQLNNGNETFSEIGQLAGISNTDWSWSALLADYDNDSWKDLYITNGYFRDYTNMDFIKYMDDFVKEKGRLVREDVLEIINRMPASDVVNYMFVNQGNGQFKNATKPWGLYHKSNSNGAAYADLDNDGDLDLIVNNINLPAFIYRNDIEKNDQNQYLQVKLVGEDLNTSGIGAKVTIIYDGKKQVVEQYPTRGYLSSVSPLLHFGLGAATVIDTLTITWARGKQEVLLQVPVNQVVTLEEKNASLSKGAVGKALALFQPISSPIHYEHPQVPINDFDRQPLLLCGFSTSGPCMASADVNQDGLEDVFIGGALGQPGALYLQQKNKTFALQEMDAFLADKGYQDADAAFLDVNGDGALDIYVASGGYHQFNPNDPVFQDRIYLNDGTGNFTRKRDALPDLRSSKGCVAAYDFNKDGFDDVFVGGRVMPGRYPETPASYILTNAKNGRFIDETKTVAPAIEQIGMVTDASWSDLDGDGNIELVLVGEWMPVTIFTYENGQFNNATSRFLPKPFQGWWNTVVLDDLNLDGKPDIIAGNLGLNTQFRASDEAPAQLFFKDFDKNGSVDPIFCNYVQGKSYPYVTRDELLTQLSVLKSRYTSYEKYANETLTSIFKPAELKDAGHLIANWLETTLFLSQNDGTYQVGPLPVQAQYAPVQVIKVLDYDKDGNKDLLLFGNNEHFKLRLGKMDANYGVLFKGKGNGQFEYISQQRSGFKLVGDVKSVVSIGDLFIIGRNQKPVVAYQMHP